MVLDDTVKEFLKSATYALIPVKLSLGEEEQTLFLLKSTGDVLDEIKSCGKAARIAWVVRATPAGPVISAVFDASSGGTARLTVEAYFDPFDDGDMDLLASMAAQERLKAALFNADTDLVGLVEVGWGEIERLALEQAIDRAEELAENALFDGLELDFAGACAAFREETSIDGLAEKAFPPESH